MLKAPTLRACSVASTSTSSRAVLCLRMRSAKLFRPVVCKAKKDTDLSSGLEIATSTIQSAVNSAADLVPESVPRPVARGAVATVGALVVFGLVKQVLSGLFTLVLLGGLGYWWLTKDGGDDDDNDSKPSSRRGDREDDDPLSEGRRIMDKYK